MRNVLCAVLLLAPLAGCAMSTETEQTGSTSEAVTPAQHSYIKPKISVIPLSGAASVSHAAGADVPEPPPAPGGPVEGILGAGLDVPEPSPSPGGPVER
jgi:hypothetical protein